MKDVSKNIDFTKNKGLSIEDAIILTASNDFNGIIQEYSILRRKFGDQFKDWDLTKQSLVKDNDKLYDKMEIKLKNGKMKIVFLILLHFLKNSYLLKK